MEVVMRVVNALLGRGPPPTRRTIALLAAAYAANVIENALSAAVASGAVDLTYSQKDACFARCEELLVEWSGVNAFELMLDGSVQPVGSGAAAVAANRWQGERERMGWTDVMAGVVGVYLKMDSML